MRSIQARIRASILGIPDWLPMTGWLTIVVSGISGAAVTLVGVVAGGAVASRSQRRQLTRDKQIDACAVAVQESTRMQIALLRYWKHEQEIDWTAWNQALAMIWLVGIPDVIAAARRMDRVFWLCGSRIKSGQMTSEETWSMVRDEMEAVRLDFINAARRSVVGASARVDDAPVARPPLWEIREMFGSPADPPDSGPPAR